MTDRKAQIVIAVSGLLAILAAAFGFAAEGTRITSGGIIPYDLCKYPHTPATYFGGTAAALLLVAQLFVHAFAGCMCCTKRADASGRSVKVAWATLFFSWFSFLGGEFLLLVAAALNRPRVLSGFETCEASIKGWSAGGAVLALTSVFLGIWYYYLVESFKRTASRSAPKGGRETSPTAV